ncbi:MAG: TetR/AcrR family transcriptional regulator [Clostridiales bacterium]|nr:TetR/AcrR family transcriptional regulator [Clostridiales bacterium]
MSVRDTSIDPRLIQSAREEFMANGFLKADLKRICENAGVTTGAVYKRYKGKEELFQAVVKDAVDKMDSFIELRTELDFSGMSDEQIRNTRIMNEDYVLDMFRMIWDIRKDIYILLEKSSGTSYENYTHDFAHRMTKAYMQYYLEAKKRGLAKSEISEEQMHVLCTAFWTAIYEPFIHKMSWKKIEGHCKVICRYFNWAEAIGLT